MSIDSPARSGPLRPTRSRSPRLRVAAAAGVVVLVAGTAACGDDDSADDSLPAAIVGTSEVTEVTEPAVATSVSTAATTTVAAPATTTGGSAIAGQGDGDAPTGSSGDVSGSDAPASGAPTASAVGGSAPDDSAPVSTTAECEDYQTNVQYPLEKCNTGYVIVLVQSVLKNFGYYDGQISGDFDDATEQSVRDYQDAMELEVDGLVGSQTWRRMLPNLNVEGTDNNGNGVIDPFEVAAG
ncbi:MAG: peptidoglycan-binding protein [Acidimicrobiales bacterium]